MTLGFPASALISPALLTLALGLASCAAAPPAAGFRSTFPVDKTRLASTGTSRYFVLEPGYRLSYQHGNATLTITVLKDTQLIDGVQTRVMEEREEEAGMLVEVSRNYFALDPATGDVYYFGEDVDLYKNGQVAGHGGSWRSGVSGAHFGLMMPGSPKVGQKYQQEVAPGIVLDRAQVTSVTATVSTPAGAFKDCLQVAETSPLEQGVGHKTYAPGVGLVQDDALVLVRIEKPNAR